MKPNKKTPSYPNLLVVLTALLVLAWPRSGWAQFDFITNADKTITITGYTGPGGVVTIPGTINNYSVTAIGTNAFYQQFTLTSVTIPDSVTSIGDEAFNDCSGLASVTIGNGVTHIGIYAFAGCGLTSVTIPDSVIDLGSGAFACFGLTNIDVNATNSSYASAGGVLFNKTLTTLIQYPGGLTGSYAIPDSVTSIGAGAFDSCSGLTSVTIPDSVTSIGAGAFDSCSRLTSVTIPDSVTNIGDWAFANCNWLYGAYFQGNAPSVNGGPGSADTTVFAKGPHSIGSVECWVYYVPGTTGWGAYFGGSHTAWWYQPRPQILGSGYGLGPGSNGFQFTISWATNAAVVVEASTNLQTWTPVSTNTLISGTNLFWDADWTNHPQRFYRVGVEQ